MANLLERYGLKADLENKKFSISFIDNFVDCSYRVFLTYFMGLWQKNADIPKVFGSGCHRGLAKINELMLNHTECCKECKHDCKLFTVNKVKAMQVPMEECRIKQLMMEEFLIEFNEEFEELALSTMKNKPIEEVKETLKAHHQYAYNDMCSAMFERQPVGEILMTENDMTGKLGEHDIRGVVDLVIGTENEKGAKALVLDYKTTGCLTNVKFPMRQLCMYVHLLEQRNLPINGIAALYMVKKNPPKVVRKNSTPFQATKLLFTSLDQDRSDYERNLQHLNEDMNQIKDAIVAGNFVRNRKSQYCPCDQWQYCENFKLLDKAVEDGLTYVTRKKE